MRFQKAATIRSRRGPDRRKYRVGDLAHRHAGRTSLGHGYVSDRETLVIKLLIWQLCFDDGPRPRPSHRFLARQLGVTTFYVHKIQGRAQDGLDALARGNRVTLEDL